jgi:molybdopterin-guanine dinucleotide biosynthesis adapter protein
MRIVAIVGYSGTGKTRLVVRLIAEIKRRGLTVAAVKRCSHGFTLDTDGKDTDGFSRAGADGVAMTSPDGWAGLGQAPQAADSRLAGRLFPGVDVVLVEGGKDVRGTRKIEVLRSGVSEVAACPPGELVAVVSDGPRPGGAATPVFGPDDIAGLTDLILSLEEGDMAEIKLEVDGREVNMNAFVQMFIEKTVVGMVTALSGVDPEPKRISLVIDRGGAATDGGPKP